MKYLILFFVICASVSITQAQSSQLRQIKHNKNQPIFKEIPGYGKVKFSISYQNEEETLDITYDNEDDTMGCSDPMYTFCKKTRITLSKKGEVLYTTLMHDVQEGVWKKYYSRQDFDRAKKIARQIL